MLNAPVLNFNVPRRARNGQPLLPVEENMANNSVSPVMHVDPIEFARTMATVMAEKDKKSIKDRET